MSQVNQSNKNRVRKLTIETLNQLLMFATTFKIQKFIINRNSVGYRDFEALISSLDYEEGIQGTGIIAQRQEIAVEKPKYEQGLLYDEVPLGAHELGAYIDSFPLSAAAASYVFTILEVYGNEVTKIVSPNSLNRNKAWHEDIKGTADLQDTVQVETAKKAFAKHFSASEDQVPKNAATQMVNLKRIRNDFAHDANSSVDFSEFLHDTLAVVCHIAFLTTNEDRFSVYPWEDHMEVFSPQSKA